MMSERDFYSKCPLQNRIDYCALNAVFGKQLFFFMYALRSISFSNPALRFKKKLFMIISASFILSIYRLDWSPLTALKNPLILTRALELTNSTVFYRGKQ